ncbi:MAG: hypothetical protein AAGN35_12040 [Bacteroidota bacterium]
MLKIIVGCLALLLTLPGMAQEVTARLDLSRKEPEPQWIEYSPTDGGLVTVSYASRRSSRILNINKYDDLFNRQWSDQVLTQNGRAYIDLLTVLGDNIYVFVSEYFPRDRTIKTSYSHYDLDGNVIAEREVISELPNVKEHRVDLKYTRSINKKRLLCYKNLNNAGKREKVLYYLFDAESDEVISGEITIPYPDDKFTIRKIVVSNSGMIYVLGKYYHVNRVKTPDDYGFKVYRYLPGDPNGVDVDVELEEGNLFITDLTMKIDPQEYIYLAGFYSTRSTREIIGTCSIRLDEAMETDLSSIQRFSDAFLNNFLKERQIDRGKELKNFYLDNIILRSDGGLLLIAEKFYTTYNNQIDIYGTAIEQRIYHYDDIIVSSVDGNGDLEWSNVARKRQASPVQTHLSYLDVVSGASLFLVYDYSPRRQPRTLYFNSVGMNGDVEPRDVLLPDFSGDDWFYPRMSAQISNEEAMLVYYQNRSKVFSIVKVAF